MKKWSKLLHLLTVRADVADPPPFPPPYSQPDCKISAFFWRVTFRRIWMRRINSINDSKFIQQSLDCICECVGHVSVSWSPWNGIIFLYILNIFVFILTLFGHIFAYICANTRTSALTNKSFKSQTFFWRVLCIQTSRIILNMVNFEYCLPQNCRLGGNPDVDNFELVHQ